MRKFTDALLLPLTLLLALMAAGSASADEDLSFDLPLANVDVRESAENAARDWTALGIAAMGEEDALGAIEHFTAGSHFAPDRPGVWVNLAVSLTALASRIVPQSALVLLCEAEQAALLAGHLLQDSGAPTDNQEQEEEEVGADGSAGTAAAGGAAAGDVVRAQRQAAASVAAKLQRVEAALAQRGAAATASCAALPASSAQLDSGALDEALSLERQGRHVQAANALCGSAAALTVALPEAERARGVLSAATMRRVYVLQRVCGVVHLQRVLPLPLVDELAAAQAAHFGARLKGGGGGEAARGDSLRLEVPLPLVPPFTAPGLVGARFTLAATRLWGGSKQLELDTFSYIHAKPGSRAQAWHIDVPALFEPKSALRDGDAAALRHLPPPGVVAVVPLLDLLPSHGPTEFLTGSHVQRGAKFWSGAGDRGVNGVTPTISVAARRGSVVLFDLRLRHRGGANAHAGGQHRAVLYMSYVQSWYRDAVNFRERQGAAWDALPSGQLRGLFGRLGTRAYTAALEDALRALGVDVEREHVSAKHLAELAAQARGQKLS